MVKSKNMFIIRKIEQDNEHIILYRSEDCKKKEDAFRLLKSDLGLRPFYHHTTDTYSVNHV